MTKYEEPLHIGSFSFLVELVAHMNNPINAHTKHFPISITASTDSLEEARAMLRKAIVAYFTAFVKEAKALKLP